MDDGWQGKLARASVGLLGFIEDKDFLWHAATKRHGIHLAAAPGSERNYKHLAATNDRNCLAKFLSNTKLAPASE